MCLAIPGKIVKIDGENATVDYIAEKREANCSLIDCKIGDYVIVQNRFILQTIPTEEALKTIKAWEGNDT